MAFQNPIPEERKKILQDAKVIAVVGLSDHPFRSSYMISQAMQNAGYKIIPVNPLITESLGEKAIGSLLDLTEPVDIINVFRRTDQLVKVAEDAVKYGKAKVIWFQQGLYSEKAAEQCLSHGMTVVMNQCIKVDHAILVRK